MDQIFDRYMKVLKQTEWMPRVHLVRYQEGLIEALVRHADEHVPFYRDRLACLFTGSGEIDLSRWNEVPIVTRAEAAAHAPAMRSPPLPVTYGAVGEIHTSGSTGPALPIASNKLISIAGNAAATRLAHWFGVDTSRPLATIKVYPHGTAPQYPDGRDSKGWSHASPEADSYNLDLFTPVEKQLEWLLRKRAPYLMTSSSNAMALAYAATSEQARKLGIEVVFAIAETVLPRAREIVAERLGARIAAIYSCEEIGVIATQCPLAPHYHVVSETTLVEILRDDGSAAAPGEIGQVALTGFYNYAMPFIRYAIGDVATAGPNFCVCGRSLPVIAQVDGRTRYAFVFKDGTRVWPRLWSLAEIGDFVAYREFQMVQLDHQRIELRYVPDDTDRVPDSAGLAAYLRQKLHSSAEIILKPVDMIPRSPSGKFDPFVSLIAD